MKKPTTILEAMLVPGAQGKTCPPKSCLPYPTAFPASLYTSPQFQQKPTAPYTGCQRPRSHASIQNPRYHTSSQNPRIPEAILVAKTLVEIPYWTQGLTGHQKHRPLRLARKEKKRRKVSNQQRNTQKSAPKPIVTPSPDV